MRQMLRGRNEDRKGERGKEKTREEKDIRKGRREEKTKEEKRK